MVKKHTIAEIVKKVDRKIENLKEAEYHRIDFPPPGVPFDINAALAYEINPDKSSGLAQQLAQLIKIGVTSIVLFFIFFFLFNAPAYIQILGNNVVQIMEKKEEVQMVVEEEPVQQELLVLSKDPMKQKTEFPELNLALTPPDNRLIIPKINKDVPIVEVLSDDVSSDLSNLDEEILESLKDGVVRYPGTALPGEEGNSFLTGHSSYYFWDGGEYNEVFALLPELEIGDEVQIYYNQQRFTYRIIERKEVLPSEVDVLKQPEGEKQLTLMTCTPVGTNLRRLILVAELVEG